MQLQITNRYLGYVIPVEFFSDYECAFEPSFSQRVAKAVGAPCAILPWLIRPSYYEKTWCTAQEIADLRLLGLPTTKVGVLLRVKKERWPSRQHIGSGGGREYPLIHVLTDSQLPDMSDELRHDLHGRLKVFELEYEQMGAVIKRLNRILKAKDKAGRAASVCVGEFIE